MLTNHLVLFQEEEQYQIDILTQERDLARQAYTALSSQLKETRIIENNSIKIGAKAILPNKAIGPNTGLITGLGSTLGLFIIVGYFFLDAWLNDDGL